MRREGEIDDRPEWVQGLSALLISAVTWLVLAAVLVWALRTLGVIG